MLKIGEVARRSGVGIGTVRFYENKGLLPPPARTASGYRIYPLRAVQQVRFIQHAKSLGFSLREIAELIALKAGDAASSAEVRRRAQAKVADIRDRIAALQRIEAVLGSLVEQCDPAAPLAACPILAALDDDELMEKVRSE